MGEGELGRPPWVCLHGGLHWGVGRAPPKDTWDTMGYGQQARAVHILLECFLVRNKDTHYINVKP